MSTDTKSIALGAFADLLHLPPLAGLAQRGRDPETARYTLALQDGRTVRIGTIKILWSQAELARVLAVTLGIVPPSIKADDWRNAIAALIRHVVDVEETPGETFEDAVREWAIAYGHQATTDRDGAARRGDPFHDDGDIHLTAGGLARYIRREYSEQVRLADLRQALVDVGFERITIRYDRNPKGTGDERKRSSTSYYRLALIDLDPAADDA